MSLYKQESAVKNAPDNLLMAVMQGRSDDFPQWMAMAELTRRREINVAGKGAEAKQQLAQGKVSVKDRMMSRMLPEELGIGMLPAENMQAMAAADGGIVGYAGGGEVARYNGKEESYVTTPWSRFTDWYTGTAVPYVGKKMLSLATAGAPEAAEDIIAAKKYLTTPTTHYKAPKDLNETQAAAYDDARGKGYTPEAARAFATDPQVQGYVKQYGAALSKSPDFATFQADPSKYVAGQYALGAKNEAADKRELERAGGVGAGQGTGAGRGAGQGVGTPSMMDEYFKYAKASREKTDRTMEEMVADLKAQKADIAQARQDAKGIAALRMAQGFATPGKPQGLFGLTGLSEALGGAAEEGQRAITAQQAAEQALVSQKLQMSQLQAQADKGDMDAALKLKEIEANDRYHMAYVNALNARSGASGGMNPRLYATLMGQVDKATKDYVSRNPGATQEQIQVFQQQDLNRRIRMAGGKGLGDSGDIGFALPGKGATIRE